MLVRRKGRKEGRNAVFLMTRCQQRDFPSFVVWGKVLIGIGRKNGKFRNKKARRSSFVIRAFLQFITNGHCQSIYFSFVFVIETGPEGRFSSLEVAWVWELLGKEWSWPSSLHHRALGWAGAFLLVPRPPALESWWGPWRSEDRTRLALGSRGDLRDFEPPNP